ncbi:hypothetical protein [Piscinibacter gummiphilus]|uniref:Uncharacterized protein n=1 Tax=Piscinibacter gummiphilus TaxID=946333 RepID=A0ABZ0D1W2_9BURK|nr:hypothetical protein [Piscinibacter gummiphilus]WOB08699.1 hypothetical protein RXV79_01275 [Piscinibacter gummiphilus]
MQERRQHGTPRWAVPVAAGAVGVMLWLAQAAGPDAPVEPAATPKPVAMAVTPSTPAAPYTRPPVLKVPPAKPQRRPLGTAEVCGYGEVQLPPDDPDPVQRIPLDVRRSALEAMDALMLASDDDQVRAAALWMGARLRGREVTSRIEQIARLAAASRDPFVYAIALEACTGRHGPGGGSCNLLSTAQWVRLDPDNAVPWQALAAEARARDEPQAEDEALQLAALAARSDVHVGRLPHLVDKALGPEMTALQRTLALSAGLSAEAVWSASHGVAVVHSAQGFDLSCEGMQRRLLALNTMR